MGFDYFGLLSVYIAFRPFETFFIADHFVSELQSFKQLISVALIILLLPSSVWWLFLFRAEDVKKQFEPP